MWYCVHILCLINPLNLSNIYSAKNTAKVNSTTKISPHFCPLRPQIALYPSRSQGCYQPNTCPSLEINNWIIPPQFSWSKCQIQDGNKATTENSERLSKNKSFTQKFVSPAWGVCNLHYKLHFLCCWFLIPQSLKYQFTCDNESFSNRRGSFIYKMSFEAHTWAVIFNSCLLISNHVTTWLKRFIYLEN